MNVGDEVLTMKADGKLLYSLTVAFLDHAISSMYVPVKLFGGSD